MTGSIIALPATCATDSQKISAPATQIPGTPTVSPYLREPSRPQGDSNGHCFNAGRYTVIHALTGGLEPSNPCSFKDVADKFVGKDGGFAWDKPESCFHEIQVW